MSCISSVGRTLLDIEELNNLQYDLELKLCVRFIYFNFQISV